jgi:hypothetical protein
VGAYKSLVAKECLSLWKTKSPNEYLSRIWHRNYFDHVIRNEPDLRRIREYIEYNPLRWDLDEENPARARG